VTPQVHTEEDFPKGHPARFDYDPASPEAKEWARRNISLKGERDFPVGHPKAVDTPRNTNHVPIRPGIDPAHPELEAHTGRTPEQAAAVRAANAALAARQMETPMLDDGRVNVAEIAERTALDFLEKQGHEPEEAEALLRELGVDKILAAKAVVGVKE